MGVLGGGAAEALRTPRLLMRVFCLVRYLCQRISDRSCSARGCTDGVKDESGPRSPPSGG